MKNSDYNADVQSSPVRNRTFHVFFCVAAIIAMAATARPISAQQTMYLTHNTNAAPQRIFSNGTIDLTFSPVLPQNTPFGMAFDSDRNLYFNQDLGSGGISQLTPAGTVTTIAINVTNLGKDMTYYGGNLYATSALDNKIVKVSPSGITSDYYSSPGLVPLGVTFDGSGNLYVSGQSPSITKISQTGVISTYATTTVGSGLDSPRFDSTGNLYVADYDHKKILKITSTGTVSDYIILPSNPNCLAIDAADQMYVSMDQTGQILRFAPDGTFLDVFASGLDRPMYMLFEPVPEPGFLFGAAAFILTTGLKMNRKQRGMSR